MFYTGIITSLLPYILLFGIFGTLLLNQVVFSNNSRDAKTGFATIQKQHKKDATNAYFFSSDRKRDKKEDPGKINTFRLFSKAFEEAEVGKRLYPPSKIPFIIKPELNNSYSLRGPPIL